MKNHTLRSAGHILQQTYEGYPLAIAPHFIGPDVYDDVHKTHGTWLNEAILHAKNRKYIIDFLELHAAFILVHHRRAAGSFLPQRPAMVFQYKWPYVTRNFHEGENRHPAGSRCLAWRENGKLYLEFENAHEIIELEGHFLRGIEAGLFGDMIEDVKEDLDEEALADLRRAAGDKDYVARKEA